MRVEELIIDGFKSYATRTVISQWDPQFNAITGLNGSGKSNILDAICFVLGISSMSTVRASNLQDLIYKRGQAGVTKASVTIVFDNSDTSKSPIGFESMNKISVTRQIVLGGTSKYLINGHRAQQQTVLQLFQSVQLNINNPNFLIMQGKITKVLNMKPTEILSLIEEAAGTKMYELHREKAEKTMDKKETKLQEIRALLHEEIEPKLEKLRNEKRTFLEFQQTQSDLENLSRISNAHSFKSLNDRYLKIKSNYDNYNDNLSTSNNLIEKLTIEITNLNQDLDVLKSKRQENFSKSNNFKQLELQQTEISKIITRLNTSKSISIDNLNEEIKKREDLIKQIEILETNINSNQINFINMENEYNKLNEQLNTWKKNHITKDELLSTLTTGVSNTGGSGGYQSQLQDLKAKLAHLNVSIEQKKIKIQHLTEQNKSIEPNLQKAKEQQQIFINEIEQLKLKKSNLENQLQSLGYDSNVIKNLKDQELQLNRKIHRLSNEANFLKRKVANLEFTYTKPSHNFDSRSVKGVVAQLFHIDQENLDSITALEVAAGGRLYNVVVDNEKTGADLLERGQLRRRVTIIPLNKIAAWTIPQKTIDLAKQVCPNKVELALNLIGYEHEVSKAMEFIFGQRLVCKDAETAKKVTFHPQIRARSVTWQGDVYDPEGTLSGGSRRNGGSTLTNIQNYNNINNQLISLQNELKYLQIEINKLNQLSDQTKNIQNDLNLTNHQIQLAEKNLNSTQSSNILSKFENNNKEIDNLKSEISNITNDKQITLQEISKTEKDIEEFSNNKDSKLDELKLEVTNISKEINNLEKLVKIKSDQYQSSQIELEQINNDLISSKEQLTESNSSIEELNNNINSLESQLATESLRYEEISSKVEDEKSNQLGIDEEINELNKLVKQKNKSINDTKLNQQKLNHELEKLQSSKRSTENKLNELVEENNWLQDDAMLNSVVEQYQNINLNELNERISRLNERLGSMKRKVNSNVMSTIDNVEKRESSLKHMVKTIEKDKAKIQSTIVTLNDHKRETLIKTWEKVSKDFGQIFGDLLPNSFSKLEPPEGKDVTEGLEVKVRLGKVWKDSLVELSGGQRSLIALSLILALLQFKPAPMYILDEVDAALDLSHTQNIGHLIKTRFKGSQFIIVSLKEGMFNNANRVFRTRFQDGTSVVSIM
ncbi:hypothetical protein WICMUC_002592 [Wickerhamomyces mucosus]|uniref:SMC hinge domain-containing protein n=1 Tax=Wickerhamomyces mucosus TaxID=1378264 RepID=A0A9P8PQE7_9ASCO|nr:hypothetical protein WICMUC_002592 [Wickerhamomyces mucosus]